MLKSKKLTIILMFAAGIILLTASEFIYTYKNRPQIFGLYYLWRAQKMLATNPQNSLGLISKGAKINIHFLSKKYNGLIPKTYDLKANLPANSDQLIADIKIYIESLNIQEISSTEMADLSKAYYDLAIVAFNNSANELGKAFLQTAVYLNPELGHYHVELANYYLNISDKNKAIETIDFCLKFNFPKKQCEDYKERYLIPGIKEKIGFLNDGIIQYYSKGR